MAAAALVLKTASEPHEFEQIHQLNYRTFVEEIPQHPPNADRRLVDKFHDENTYVIALEGQRLVAMVCLRGRRPFSLDQKLPNLDSLLPPGRALCEFRLLAIEREYRSTQLCRRLMSALVREGIQQGFDYAIISGTTRQLRLYEHLGFEPFGPLVGTGEATFQPMGAPLETYHAQTKALLSEKPPRNSPVYNFLPGPVAIHEVVKSAHDGAPISHRSREFLSQRQFVEQKLCDLTGTRRVALLSGSGTLANDVVAGQLSLQRGRGLIVSNGEFGERLLDHARRWNLRFDDFIMPWGNLVDFERLEQVIQESPGLTWLWAVHCETSTGMLTDLPRLQTLCDTHGLRLCVDAISSLGLVETNLSGAFLATGVSGKGLASYSGLSFVFTNHQPAAAGMLPRVLDLAMYLDPYEVPFTQSSNLLQALAATLGRLDLPARTIELECLSRSLRERIGSLGLTVLAVEQDSNPAVLTIPLPDHICSLTLGEKLEEHGILLSYRSEYLASRNWIQICMMGETPRAAIARLVDGLAGEVRGATIDRAVTGHGKNRRRTPSG